MMIWQKHVLQEQAAPLLFTDADVLKPDDWVNPGACVVIRITGVPAAAVSHRPAWLPMAVSGLLKYEDLTSVCHFSILRHTEYDEPVKSKVQLLSLHLFLLQPEIM